VSAELDGKLDDRILVRARSGRWRAVFRVRPDVTPPTEDEAAALAEAIVEALAAALTTAQASVTDAEPAEPAEVATP